MDRFVHLEPTQGGFYFNEIDCSSETHCVAVAEGDNGWIFTTRDGGKTWNKEMVEIGEHGSCMGAQMLSETEVRHDMTSLELR
jgi:photosystem II stability/assembly factor-like uncharacterized protein